MLGVEARGVDVRKGAIDVERYKEVATTLRESISASENVWSALLSDGEQFYAGGRYGIWIVDRVGGGDSFSGGLIYGLLSGMNCQDAVKFAVAASCLKHSIHGDVNQVSKEEVMALVDGDGSG